MFDIIERKNRWEKWDGQYYCDGLGHQNHSQITGYPIYPNDFSVLFSCPSTFGLLLRESVS